VVLVVAVDNHPLIVRIKGASFRYRDTCIRRVARCRWRVRGVQSVLLRRGPCGLVRYREKRLFCGVGVVIVVVGVVLMVMVMVGIVIGVVFGWVFGVVGVWLHVDFVVYR